MKKLNALRPNSATAASIAITATTATTTSTTTVTEECASAGNGSADIVSNGGITTTMTPNSKSIGKLREGE